MKIRKILTMFSLILMSIVTMSGCATIDSIRIVNPDYSIIDRLVVTLDESSLKKSGKNLDEIYELINNDIINMSNYINNWIAEYEDNYDDIYQLLVKGIKCNTLKYYDDNNQLLKSQLGFEIEFAGIDYFGLFYGFEVTDSEFISIFDDELYTRAIEDIGPFIKGIINNDHKTESMGIFLYKYSMINDDGLISNIQGFGKTDKNESYYDKYANLTNCDLNDVQINQLFTYPDDRIKSNADDVEVVDGMSLMYWDLSNKEDDFQMSIYYLTAKTSTWYILGIVLSVITIVVIFIVIKCNHNNDDNINITK